MVLTLKYGGVPSGSSTPGYRGGSRRNSGASPFYPLASADSMNATGLNYSGVAGARGDSPPPPFRAAPHSALREGASYFRTTSTPFSADTGGFRSSNATRSLSAGSTGPGFNPDGSKNHLSYRSTSPTFMYRAPQPQEVEMVTGNPNILRSEATYGRPALDNLDDDYQTSIPPPPRYAPPAGGGMRWNVEPGDEDRLPSNDEADGGGRGVSPQYDIAPLPPYPDEDRPVVPENLLPPSDYSAAKELDWESHPSSAIVLALLRERGIVLPHHNRVVRYHMAIGFLDYLSVVQAGAYFVKYKRANAAPKERYMRVVMDEGEPFLVWTLHDQSYQLIDRVPLAHLVGVSANIKSAAFRRHLVSQNLIKGCHAGQHRPRLPTNGALTLWFWDNKSRKPRSVDILTTSMATHMLWKKTFDAILSVNSTSVTGKVVNLDELRNEAEDAMLSEENDDLDG